MRPLNLYFYILLLIIAFSCNQQTRSPEDSTDLDDFPTTDQPKKVKLNLDGGYAVNQFTGDSIQPIVNSLGDTLITGVPIPARGRVIRPDSVAKPKIVLAGKPKVVPTHLNVHKIPEELTVIPINKDSLKTFTPGIDTSSFVLVNSTGDTIPTGVPIPTKGKKVPTSQPQPVKASPFAFKDNAINNMKYLDMDQGMASSLVLSILEDSQGNLWFGTQNAGVSRYDGEFFTHFTEEQGLSSNEVFSILEDSQGNLWFGTWDGGVSRYDGEFFTHFTEEQGLSHNIVYTILEDTKGNLWFGTRGGGVSRYDGESFTHFTQKQGLCSNYVMSILEDSQGNLWFGTWGGVSRYDGKSFTHFTEEHGLGHNRVTSILEDSQGNLWFGTWGGGVSKLVLSVNEGSDGESLTTGQASFTNFTENEGLSNNIVWSMLEDNQGNLWFGTWGGGVSRYDGESFTHFTEKEGLGSNFVYSVLKDSHGNLWFGTWGGGVSRYNGESFTHFTEKEGLGSNIVYSTLEDSHGNLWFGTRGGGVSRYDGETFTHYTEKQGLSHSWVFSILEDSQGNLWFGTRGGGVSKLVLSDNEGSDGETFTHFTEEQGLSHNIVHSIVEDSQGNLWFGTQNGGVSRFDGESFTHFTEKEGLSNNWVYSILEDSQGNLWFGTRGGGVSRYDGESFTHFTEKEGLGSNIVYSILEDSQGNLWFGTWGRGVSRFDGEYFTHFTENQGLSNNYVNSILEDKNNNLWVSTESGLNQLVFEDGVDVQIQNLSDRQAAINNSKKVTINTFGRQDGLKGLDFNNNSVYLDSKNRIWWGSGKALTMLDMNNFKTLVKTPEVRFNQLDINDKFVDFRNIDNSIEMEFENVPDFYNYPLNLKLPYNNNHLTFYFSAIDWEAPHKIRYSFRMEGLNDGWSQLTEEAKADYRNLPYGQYTFEVRAIGQAHKWSETFEYSFIILPPWWLTWWSKMGYLITVALSIIGLIRIRTSSLKRQKKELEIAIIERTVTVVAQKEEIETALEQLQHTQSQLIQSEKMASLGVLTAGIAHEINNPLNFISSGTVSLENDVRDLNSLTQHFEGFIKKLSKQDQKKWVALKRELYYEDIQLSIPEVIKYMKIGTSRVVEIVKGLKTYSRLDVDDLFEIDIHEGLDATLALVKSNLSDGIEIIKNYDQDLKLVSCYPGPLNQVFMNLIGNAIDAIKNTGTITITTAKNEKDVSISIKDNGTGMPPEVFDKIFDPFFTTKAIGKGTGLGLSISKGIIEKHNGQLTVNSTVGEGSEFVIILPIKKDN